MSTVDPSLHRLTARSGVWENDILTITHCPQTDVCAVWHECHEPGCRPTHDDEVDGERLHGLDHRMIDYSWMSRDEPHNCGVSYSDEWQGVDALGDYTFDVEYENGNWYPIDIEKVET